MALFLREDHLDRLGEQLDALQRHTCLLFREELGLPPSNIVLLEFGCCSGTVCGSGTLTIPKGGTHGHLLFQINIVKNLDYLTPDFSLDSSRHVYDTTVPSNMPPTHWLRGLMDPSHTCGVNLPQDHT